MRASGTLFKYFKSQFIASWGFGESSSTKVKVSISGEEKFNVITLRAAALKASAGLRLGLAFLTFSTSVFMKTL